MNDLKQLWYWFTKARHQPSGLLPLPPDDRDITIDHLMGGLFGSYTPAATSKVLGPIFPKDQMRRSNCSFQAWSRALSVFCGENVSARYLTAKAYQQGLCQTEGYANLRSGGKVAQQFGFCLESECPSDETLSFADYVKIDFKTLDDLAAQRKVGAYYSVTNSDNYLRAIDAGHAVVLGRTWLSSMNQGGGLSWPWIIKRIGYAVGGHSTSGIGYNLAYQLLKVGQEKNSYSDSWGDNGCFYCPLIDLNKDIAAFGAFAITSIVYQPKITSQNIIDECTGKNVRGDRDGTIYLIYDGKKMPYKNDVAFLSINGYPYSQKGAFIMVPQAAIDGVPYFSGEYSSSILDGSGGDWAQVVKLLRSPVNNNFDPTIPVNNYEPIVKPRILM